MNVLSRAATMATINSYRSLSNLQTGAKKEIVHYSILCLCFQPTATSLAIHNGVLFPTEIESFSFVF